MRPRGCRGDKGTARSAEKGEVMAKQKCEGCRKPATTQDVEGVPLCQECHDAADHAESCKCPPCLEEKIVALVDEVREWRKWFDSTQATRKTANCAEGEQLAMIKAVRELTDETGVLQLYSKPAEAGITCTPSGCGVVMQ